MLCHKNKARWPFKNVKGKGVFKRVNVASSAIDI